MSVSYFRPDYNFNCRLTADLQWLITFCGDKMGCSLNCGNAVTLWWTKCCIRPSFNVHFSLPADIPLLKEAWSLPGLRQHRLQSSLTVSISLLTRTDCGWQPTSLLWPPPPLSSWHEKCLELFHSQFSHCNLCLPPSLTMQSKANNRPSLALGVVMPDTGPSSSVKLKTNPDQWSAASAAETL